MPCIYVLWFSHLNSFKIFTWIQHPLTGPSTQDRAEMYNENFLHRHGDLCRYWKDCGYASGDTSRVGAMEPFQRPAATGHSFHGHSFSYWQSTTCCNDCLWHPCCWRNSLLQRVPRLVVSTKWWQSDCHHPTRAPHPTWTYADTKATSSLQHTLEPLLRLPSYHENGLFVVIAAEHTWLAEPSIAGGCWWS